MTALKPLLVLLALACGPLAPGTALAQTYDGIDNDGDGQIDEPDEYDGAGSGMGQTEVLCDTTGRLDYCLAAYSMYCREFGLPGSCALIQIGSHCQGGDPGQCAYFQDLMTAKAACFAGDQPSCDWYLSQPVAQVRN